MDPAVSCCSPRWISTTSVALLVLSLIVTSRSANQDSNPTQLDTQHNGAAHENLNDLAVSASQDSGLSTNSHKIIASGWPTTSPMWPSNTAAEGAQNTSNLLNRVEPFIFADEPRSNDYILWLSLNKTVLNILKSSIKPVSVNLSFEFYFSHDPKTTAVPGIKIEVDRKQFKYLEPSASGGIKTRTWLNFNERIPINDLSQLDNPDWLRFSLVNRQSPSLVAIRRLKVEFVMRDQETPPQKLEKPQAQATDLSTVPTTFIPGQSSDTPSPKKSKNNQGRETRPDLNGNPIPQETDVPNRDIVQPAASQLEKRKVKPPDDKKSGWGILGKRRKRDVDSSQKSNTNSSLPDSITLTCYDSRQCDWKAEVGQEVQWSLARMPPSTETVQSGYYYVSNRSKYGDLSKILSLHLHQTDSATIADQNSDHCLDLAFYVTELSYLNVYRLVNNSTPDNNENRWKKQSLLLTWAPTMVLDTSDTSHRARLPGSKDRSMNPTRSGWIRETLCFGDFFPKVKDCGSGKCGIGFEMVTDIPDHHQKHFSLEESFRSSDESDHGQHQETTEQVVGVALLKEYAVNVPLKTTRNNWLQTWQRDEVNPDNDWKFYPKSDIQIGSNNISFGNLYDDAHYYIESDWLKLEQHLEFAGTILIDSGLGNKNQSLEGKETLNDGQMLFQLKISTSIVDSNFETIHTTNSSLDWVTNKNESISSYALISAVSDNVMSSRNGRLKLDDSDEGLFKLVLEFVLDCHWLLQEAQDNHLPSDSSNFTFSLSLSNVSVSDRCYPSPCQFGSCQQNGTNYEDWNCSCDEKHRGRHCEFGRWCNIPHVTPWSPALLSTKGVSQAFVIKPPPGSISPRQGKAAIDSTTRVSGKDYCQRKLGTGSKCLDMDIPLNENLYTEEDKTFTCSCQDDYYLSDDSKCKQAHLCNSVICPSLGMICDETKPFNRSQPCHCNDKQDWFPDPEDPMNKCIRKQCNDKVRDCGFEAHICLPTLISEKPICKCGSKFTLKTNEKGQKYCQSTACVLPTLNDCEQVCIPNNDDLSRPFTCTCHPGYNLNPDGRSCSPSRNNGPHCKPSCNSQNQICTDVGCKCKQGYIGEAEVIVSAAGKPRAGSNIGSNSTQVEYTKSVRCLNVCSLTYAENKEEFEMIESVCPLGLCDPGDFQCRCADPSSSALINTKYEPIYANSTKERVSPLCHLRRVCEPESSSYKICHSQGAICVPDYTKAAMFDCICPPSTEKKLYGQGTSGEFTCEPKCGSKKYDCLRRQAICKLVDKDQVRCECLPGLMFNEVDQKCYLAQYSYSFNLILVNRYYEPESRFHKIEYFNSTDNQSNNRKQLETPAQSADSLDIFEAGLNPNQFNRQMVNSRSTFIAELNQCNVTQVIPSSVIDDPYEHDIESYLGYIDQCNEKIHQNMRTYHLNSKLAEDVRQSLRQHLRDFTVTTSNNTCTEIDSSGMYLNCTVYLQSNEPIQPEIVEFVFGDCDKNGQDDRYCWIKPKLLLRPISVKTTSTSTSTNINNNHELKLLAATELNFRQIIPCELNNFCGQDAFSMRMDEKTSLCSCKCPQDIEVIDVKELEPRSTYDDPQKLSLKEVCAPRNHCGANSTFCLIKSGSTCHYDIRLGSRCLCIYPSYEDNEGRCVEVTYSRLDNSWIVIITLLGTGLIVSIAINLTALMKAKSVLGRSKQYPLREFPRTNNRSTGIPNPGFTND